MHCQEGKISALSRRKTFFQFADLCHSTCLTCPKHLTMLHALKWKANLAYKKMLMLKDNYSYVMIAMARRLAGSYKAYESIDSESQCKLAARQNQGIHWWVQPPLVKKYVQLTYLTFCWSHQLYLTTFFIRLSHKSQKTRKIEIEKAARQKQSLALSSCDRLICKLMLREFQVVSSGRQSGIFLVE